MDIVTNIEQSKRLVACGLEHKNWIDSKELTSDALMYSDSMIDGRGGMFYHIQVKFYYEKGHLMDAAVSMIEWLAQRKLIKTKAL